MHSHQTRRRSVHSLTCLLVSLMLSVVTDCGIAEEIETKDGGVPVIRLSIKAGTTGWLGRRPQKQQVAGRTDATGTNPEADRITSPRLQHLNDVPSPPAAPPSDPDEPLLPIRRFNLHPQSAPPITPVRTAQANHAKSVRLVKQVSQSRTVEASVGDNGPPVTDVTPAANAKTKLKADYLPDTEFKSAGDEGTLKSNPPMLLKDLQVSRPLRSISLSASIRSVNIQGDELRQPENHAAGMFAQYGVYHDLPVFQADGQGWCCDFPIFYNPLYFEDPNMERCGQGYGCFTEAASIVRFFGRIPLIPYLKGSNPSCTCVRSLGNCPACHRYGMNAYVPPLNVPGVAAQTAAVVALVFLIP